MAGIDHNPTTTVYPTINKQKPMKMAMPGNFSKNFLIKFSICDASVTRPILTAHLRLEKVKLMAERVGFEPTVPVRVHTLSKRAP